MVLPNLAIDRAKAPGQVLQAGETAGDGRLAAAGRTENGGHTRRWSSEACIQVKSSEGAAERGLNLTGLARCHGRTRALRFSISVMVRITADAKITMPPARTLASRQRDAST